MYHKKEETTIHQSVTVNIANAKKMLFNINITVSLVKISTFICVL